ncbi:MAG TPA: (4Fe-4S)-binding protein [Bacteroidales bacterium]|nr:(4Fe-4S)-binding protein [Bacteroidales bacterium]HPT21145.1 (4Fe-4S)-binding protein [Bacteroidales bacterium]
MENGREIKHFSGGRRYSNDEITVYWKPSACVHATYCYRELIEVFDPGRRPWVDMKGASTEKIIEVVNMCPTEALTWKWNDESKNVQIGEDQLNHINFKRPDLINKSDSDYEDIPVSVKIMADGPIILKGNFTLRYDGNSKDFHQNMISICRCGGSDQQPFCDGRHRKIGFNG